MDVQILTPRGEVTVRRADAAELIDLRHAILRAGLPRDTAVFLGDDEPASRHVAAVDALGRVIGCATAIARPWLDQPAFQVRGMATHPDFRGAGVGRAMLEVLESLLAEQRVTREIWCDARVPAVGFYERIGWRVSSDPFVIPSAGPHVKMTKQISIESV
jgi:GNAT superfamily N-acetyltransferase